MQRLRNNLFAQIVAQLQPTVARNRITDDRDMGFVSRPQQVRRGRTQMTQPFVIADVLGQLFCAFHQKGQRVHLKLAENRGIRRNHNGQ